MIKKIFFTLIICFMIFSCGKKGDPVYELIMEVKRDLKKQMRQKKVNVWKELLDFWPLSIVVPAMLLSLLWGAYALGS